jgi:hypothetical protein
MGASSFHGYGTRARAHGALLPGVQGANINDLRGM